MDKLKPLHPPLYSQREVVTEWGESLREEGRIDALLSAIKISEKTWTSHPEGQWTF